MAKIISINPATEEINKEFELYSKEQVVKICKDSRKAFKEWKNLDIKERGNYLRNLADVLRRKKEEYGRLITIEMGKPIKQGVAEVEKCAWTAEVYADNGEKWLEEELVQADGKKHIVTFEPLGVILSVMPWNFPFWQALRFGIPTLTAGNVSILRHSNVVPMCALTIEEAFKEAGFPENVFRTIITDHKLVASLIRSDLINGVTVTGSVGVGSRVGQLAGKYIKKFVLELGGSDPFVVLEDANIQFACKSAAQGRLINSGQSCIAAKRFIVVKEIAEEFTEKFVEFTKALKVGNPLEQDTDVGSLVNEQQRQLLEAQVKDAVDKGATVLTGGKRIEGRGFFYEPTILSNVKKNMKVVKEEVFGPVAPIIVVKNEKEAIRVANDSEFGLGASVWSTNEEGVIRVARALQAGAVFVNGIVKSDPRLPFGGIKKSGIGRELSHYGLKEFVNIKAINIY
ncbi:MAG: NAD-dependent succinate-semialdehyde dehydrogenase [Candidatus Aenigmarchaeota archaeon]|nr:NAD-dependent succinate-semialdehyde dehydrogenase [Candidatus Aenigmarchaeota archaeon]